MRSYKVQHFTLINYNGANSIILPIEKGNLPHQLFNPMLFILFKSGHHLTTLNFFT